jgi:chloramphenicol O-acetyltransferase type A
MMTDESGKKSMSMSVHVHHGLMDGYHLGEFLTFFEEVMNR